MKFSNATRQPRKKRLAQYRAPLHTRKKTVHAHLSKELRAKIGKRTLQINKGDVVKIVRGDSRKLSGKVVEVDVSRGRIFVEKIVQKKQNGKEILVPIQPSNVIITETQREAKTKAAQKTQPKKAEAKK